MSRSLKLQQLRQFSAHTYEGASAYNYKNTEPLTHLTFSFGSALFTDGFYESQETEVRNFAAALIRAWKTEPAFAWQYGAWMRDPKRGKGNRIQGSLVPALLDALVKHSAHNETYVAKCLSHRVDDVISFVDHFRQLGLGLPSASARKGMAVALSGFDEYQLMKYARTNKDLRLCDVIYMVREELEALGSQSAHVLAVGRYLHAPTRKRAENLEGLPLTQARRQLFLKSKDHALDEDFADHVERARTTWEQVFGHFGTKLDNVEGKKEKKRVQKRNRAIWDALLGTPGLMPDMAFLRNLRNLRNAGFETKELRAMALKRAFKGVWPHQVYAGYKAVPSLENVFDGVMSQVVGTLPAGRHLGIGDASGSMSVKVGGIKGSLTAMDLAFCMVGLMSQTCGLGASFSDASWGGDKRLFMAERRKGEGPLKFSQRRTLRQGMGGTQVFGAVMELITWLMQHDGVEPPDCLWFFSDMQFHPAEGGACVVPEPLRARAEAMGLGQNMPPLEMAIKLYREVFGHVDVVLWNLAAYEPVPVPSSMEGVLLVSGFDAGTMRQVESWREGRDSVKDTVSQNQEVILETVRSY